MAPFSKTSNIEFKSSACPIRCSEQKMYRLPNYSWFAVRNSKKKFLTSYWLPLKIMNGIKLILDDQGNHLDSYTISLESLRSFRSPLFCKPVTGKEHFCCLLKQIGSNMSIFFAFQPTIHRKMATRRYLRDTLFEEWMLMTIELARIDCTSKGIIWGKPCVF